MLTKPGRRGCGVRQQNGLYLCVGMNPHGRPIEEFVIDPCREFQGRAFRAPILVEKEDQPNDVLIWIGAEHYPFVPDYLEESRRMGISRRIPRDFPFEKLVPYRSRMFLVHARAIPQFRYAVTWDNGRGAPGGRPSSLWCHRLPGIHECTFNLWPLAVADDEEDLRSGVPSGVWRQTPSVRYKIPVLRLVAEGCEYARGAFAAFWVTHLEFVNKDRRCPQELLQRATESEMGFVVVEE